MQTQSIFQVGNSHTVVAIPKHLAVELGFTEGMKVVVNKSLDGKGVEIKKVSSPQKVKKTVKNSGEKEFQSWLDVFMKENGEILDELADR